MAKDGYQPDLFVGRTGLLNKIELWANEQAPSHRLWSFVAPPGTGKSWLMAAGRERLQMQLGRLVFWVDLSINPTTNRRETDLTDPKARSGWVEGIIAQARHVQGDAVRDFDPKSDFAAMLDALVDDLCERQRLPLAPIMMVDGFEEVVDDEHREWLEEHILGRYLGRRCTRLIIARRDDYSLTNRMLRWGERVEWLPVLDQQEGREQLNKRQAKLQPSPGPLNLDALLQSIPPYNWDHPHINADLFRRAVTNDPRGALLDSADLRACLDEVVKPGTLSPAAFGLLVRLAHIGSDGTSSQSLDRWTDLELLDLIGLRANDPAFVELCALGVIVPEPSSPFRRVGDGIRQIARAWRQLATGNAPQHGEEA